MLVSKRYSDFRELHTKLLHAFPEKNIPRVPMKNKSSSTAAEDHTHSAPQSVVSSDSEDEDEDEVADGGSPRSSMTHVASDLSGSSSGTSTSSPSNGISASPTKHSISVTKKIPRKLSERSLVSKHGSESVPTLPSSPGLTYSSSPGRDSLRSISDTRNSSDTVRHRLSRGLQPTVKLTGESQRLSLRAFLRSCASISSVAESDIMRSFLIEHSFLIKDLTPAETADMKRRIEADKQRLEEQFRFFQIASQRARELDHYMAEFKKELIQRDGLSRFFGEIRQKDKLVDLSPRYQKFIEWARIEVAATIYHLYVGQDNASELLAQTKRIHRLMPYALLKNVIRFSNPVSMMKTVLDLFLAQPFGQKSLLQRILYIALHEDVKMQEKAIQVVRKKINNEALCDRIQKYVDGNDILRGQIDFEVQDEAIDIIVAIAKTDAIEPPLDVDVIGRIINSWISWNIAVDDISVEIDDETRFFSNLKSLLKLTIRKRDKDMVLSLTGEVSFFFL